ncbi:DoxX family membrane protein [Pedosphaera parvula]|uniref:DoxX family protein n=1 Tax=Pedosphaera parvula (strain Ellin514) TaxID=320771 RepID=B9XQD0_PEDPL|nr:DoxX family membrane protein [Pedosphaera parvula]EEF57954.1 DoxX family protein [Pedosphaera parvula Ellin514]
MKIVVIIVRVLMGLMFLFASIVFLLNLVPQPELKGGVKTFMEGIMATHYLMTLIKVTELVCGIAFIAGRFVPLATVVIFPITLNILLTNATLTPEGLPIAIPLFLANLFLAYACRKNYATLLAAKPMS